MMKLPKEVNKIIQTLTNAQYDVWYAGQCVTAGELGESPQDWDLYTNCPQDKVRGMFPEGEPLGSRTTRMDYTEYVEYDDLNIEDRYEGIVADVVTLRGSMEDQLKEVYHFTCEAIAEHPNKSPVDPYDGMKDIHKHLLRPVGDSREVFHRDPIQMLRGLRYVGLYGFDLSKDLSEAIADSAEELLRADKEAILYEFSLAINGNYAGKYLKMLRGLGLLPAIVGPEGMMHDRRGINDYETLTENIDKVKHITLRRMALFYICFDRSYKTAVSYLPHEELDLEYLLDAKKMLPKLHFVGNDTQLKKFIYRCGGWDKYNFYDKLSKAQVIVYDYSNQRIIGRDAILKKVLEERQPIFAEDLRVDADDIIEAGITDDPERADELWHMLPDVVHEDPANNDRDKLLKYAKRFHRSKFSATFRDVKWLR
ncbi:MAG: CCA tRNA nucleotidyltransferase [Firmicutes bacterium]|nr:CCA tRNA nucleotidyltransferase [Bacillota bacterium]